MGSGAGAPYCMCTHTRMVGLALYGLRRLGRRLCAREWCLGPDSQSAPGHKMDVISKPITHGLAYRGLRLCLGPGADCGHRMHGGAILHCAEGIGPDAQARTHGGSDRAPHCRIFYNVSRYCIYCWDCSRKNLIQTPPSVTSAASSSTTLTD